MIRIQAYIVGKTGGVYHVETLTEGSEVPSKFDIAAASEDEAALTAIRRAENAAYAAQKAERLN